MDDYSPNIDQRLAEAYREAVYQLPFAKINIHIGERNAALDTFLMDNNAYSWAFITACNPGSVLLPDPENQQRHLQLLNQLSARSLRYTEGCGSSPDDNWPMEKSVMVLDISEQDAVKMARGFGQNAIVFGRLNQKPALIFCH